MLCAEGQCGPWKASVEYVLPRVEPRQLAITERIAIVQAHQLHEHVGDQYTQVLDIARLVLERHDLDTGFLRSRSFGGGRGHLLSCGVCRHYALRLRRRLLLFSFMRCVSRRRPARGLIVLLLLLLLLVLRVRWCRLDAQSRLRRRWRLRCRSRNSDGALCLLNIHDGGRAEVRRRGLVGGGLRWWVVCGGESCRRVLGTSVGV